MPTNRCPIVNRDSLFSGVLVVAFVSASTSSVIQAQPGSFELEIEQITSGTKHHFFGYIGQCQTIPWNASGRYILALEIDEIERLPKPEDAATVILIDTRNGNKIVRVDRTHAWNPQQGTMFYWHPLSAETQFFFNDRDVESGRVFTVLYDIEKRRRVREYRFHDTPIGNGGVAADGSAWLGLNYGRLARLRLVTGYPQALDWSKDKIAPEDDGIFIVDVTTGEKRLLVSYRQLDERLRERQPTLEHDGLFVNHTLWNRDSDHIYFFARAGWNRKGARRINVPFSIRADGTGLNLHEIHIGGHPEWAEGDLLIGRQGEKQILYDVTQKKVVEQWGTPEIFPDPEGDISLRPAANGSSTAISKGIETTTPCIAATTAPSLAVRASSKGPMEATSGLIPRPLESHQQRDPRARHCPRPNQADVRDSCDRES